MARWVINQVGNNLTLTYEREGAASVQCGEGPASLRRHVEAWVIEQAAPWDQVVSEHGVFVRQGSAFVRA